jgi:hypothetical protein
MSGWGLDALPQWFGSLPRLHTLRAANNELSLLPSLPATLVALDLRGNHFTEVPAQLETLTHLTSLMMCSALGNPSMLQIRHGLMPLIIGLPNLQLLSFERGAPADDALHVEQEDEEHEYWSPKSLCYLGQANPCKQQQAGAEILMAASIQHLVVLKRKDLPGDCYK